MKRQMIRPLLVLLTVTATPAAAQEALDGEGGEGVSGFIALGPGVTPAYDGAKSYQLIPFGIADVRWKGMEFELRGLRARLDVMGDSPLQVGPAINLRFKRNSSKDGDGRVKLLDDVGQAIEVGGFVGYRFGGDEKGQGEVTVDLTVLKDVNNGHDGVVATAQLSYAAYRSRRVFVNVDAQTNYGDGKYMRSYFGVTADESLRSGLATYRPGGGIRDVGAGATVGYQFSPRWGLIARAGANYYVGDAKDSPIVDEGSKLQAIAGLALSFRF
ncbi:MltA-interacting MipA family protein [Sphingobium chlorophenolicum L-1]|uniref:MltA-interacting MipA family protein n=1 Tax=Sphingobium chlorophenolicum L-1 TaxID=690566 RepID=F6F1H8_SPHCR|nr:MipA/OmpV family protein [Sphingobium chlorophenolicum]AEG51394.1 MltA-interacting MipA family protein [Sphingobium chlorophenolicum L-1]